MYKTDDGNFVSFYDHAIENSVASEEAGRPVFDTAIMCKVICPGQKNQEVHHELIRYADDGEKVIKENRMVINRFKRQFEAYKEGRDTSDLSGTPLTEFPVLTASQRATLESLQIRTVDQLAEVADGDLGNIGMGARELREKAKAYLDSASNGAVTAKLAAENERMRDEIDMLRNQVKELSALADEATKPAKRGSRK